LISHVICRSDADLPMMTLVACLAQGSGTRPGRQVAAPRHMRGQGQVLVRGRLQLMPSSRVGPAQP